jgi:hypothetical protein
MFVKNQVVLVQIGTLQNQLDEVTNSHLASISIGSTTLGLVVKAKVLYIKPHCPPRK